MRGLGRLLIVYSVTLPCLLELKLPTKNSDDEDISEDNIFIHKPVKNINYCIALQISASKTL